MKTLIRLIILLTGLVSSASAQTYTLDWGSSFSPVWATGNTSGNANNIGGSSVNCSVSMTKTGGIFTTTLGPYGGPMTPTVTSSTFVVAGSSRNLQISLDYATNTDYCDIKFTFNRPVFNVSFNLADIDRLTNTLYNYLDLVTITGTDGVVTGSPTITKYDAFSDPTFMFISGNKAYVNPANGTSGNTASDASDQKGTIKVKFGGMFITSFTIRYANYPGTIADPTVQNIAIGNISFQKSIPVPVSLISFDGKAQQDGSVRLDWLSAHETSFDHYDVERSDNGSVFTSLGSVEGKENGQETMYSFIDHQAKGGKYYYRLKMVDLDGTVNYSKVISITTAPVSSFLVYPTVVTSELNIRFTSIRSQQVSAFIWNNLGERVCEKTQPASAGMNVTTILLPATLPPGIYYVGMGKERTRIIKR